MIELVLITVQFFEKKNKNNFKAEKRHFFSGLLNVTPFCADTIIPAIYAVGATSYLGSQNLLCRRFSIRALLTRLGVVFMEDAWMPRTNQKACLPRDILG